MSTFDSLFRIWQNFNHFYWQKTTIEQIIIVVVNIGKIITPSGNTGLEIHEKSRYVTLLLLSILKSVTRRRRRPFTGGLTNVNFADGEDLAGNFFDTWV